MRSIFVGFESITEENLSRCNKLQNLNKDYTEVINKLHDLGIMINGSFVFGLDGDDQNVFKHVPNNFHTSPNNFPCIFKQRPTSNTHTISKQFQQNFKCSLKRSTDSQTNH